MIVPANSKHFYWLSKLGNTIIFNVLDALNETLREDYRLSNGY